MRQIPLNTCLVQTIHLCVHCLSVSECSHDAILHQALNGLLSLTIDDPHWRRLALYCIQIAVCSELPNTVRKDLGGALSAFPVMPVAHT